MNPRPNPAGQRRDADRLHHFLQGNLHESLRPIFCRRSPVVSATLAASAFAADWPQWLGPNRDGLTEETGLLKEWPEGGPQRVWLFEDCGYGYAGFSIVDGVLYHMGGRA